MRNPIVRGGGLGRNVINALIAAMKANGHVTRWQPGRRRLAREKLTPLSCSGGWLAVPRTWFDAKLSLKEMAAYIFLSAGNGNGRCTYAHELAERFGWTRQTTAKVLEALISHGLLAKRRRRARGTRYEALPPVLWAAESVHDGGAFVKKPDREFVKKPDHTLANPSLTNPRGYAFAAQSALPVSEAIFDCPKLPQSVAEAQGRYAEAEAL